MKKIIFILLLLPTLAFGQLTNGKIISNKATNGSIIGDSMKVGALYLKQTTAGKTITIGTYTSGTNLVYVTNLGTVSVTMSPGGSLDTSAMFTYRWTGTKWAVSAGSGSGPDTSAIHKTGNEVIRSGIKTFVISPSVPTPTLSVDAANKLYVDTKAASKQDTGTALLKDGSIPLTGDLTVPNNGKIINSAGNSYLEFGASGVLAITGTPRLSNLSPNTVPYLNGSNDIVSSTTTPTELGYVHGVTSNIQTQINAKVTGSGTSSGTNTGDETTSRINALYGYTPASTSSVSAKRDSALAAGKIVVGQTYGGGLAVTPSGDATISNAGVVAIGAGKVTNSMLADADLSKWAALDTSTKYNASNPNGYFSKTPNTFGNAVTEDFVSIADWTNVGSGTFTVSGGVLTASGGDNTANNYLRYDGRGLSNLENYTIECDIIVGTINSSSWGLGVGWVRNSAYLPSQNNVAIYPILTTANGGKIKNVSIYNAGTAVKDSSAFGLTLTAGDTLHLISTFNKDRYVTSVKNKRTNRTNDYIHVINQTVPVREVTPAAYDFTINIFGGTQKMMNFTVTANDIKSSNLLIVGHSISKGTTLESREYRYPDIISNLTTTTVTLNAGGSNRTNEINTTEALALTGQIVLIDLGLNDINNSKSVTQFGIDYRALVASFTGAGYVKGSTLFSCNITPCSTITNFANIPNYNLVIDTIMGTSGVIDLYSMLNNSGALVFPGSTSDGVHPNKGAHYLIAMAIIAKLNLKVNNFATRVPQEKQHFVDAVGPQIHCSFDGSDRGVYVDNIDANTGAITQGMKYNKQTQVYTAWTTTPTMYVGGTGLHVWYANTGATVGSAVTPTEIARFSSSGLFGIGLAPTKSWLQIKAGSTTVAPLLLTSGTNNTTAQAGAIEYDGSHFLLTPSGTSRYQAATILTGSATLDFPSTTSTTVSDLTITVTGAADGDPVNVSVPNGSITATASFWGWVSSTNTVTIRFSPKATEDPASGTFKVTVNKN